jgi:hypothetical protein
MPHPVGKCWRAKAFAADKGSVQVPRAVASSFQTDNWGRCFGARAIARAFCISIST